MKILVTGANGQLGRSLRRVLEVRHPGLTTYMTSQMLDITDGDRTMQAVKEGEFTHIINAAAYTAVDRAEDTDTGLCTAVNVDGVRNLAKAASETGAHLVHVSTDYVFDGNQGHPYTEADKPNPLSHYGTSKRKGETALLGLLPDAIILRTGWLYSPFGKNFVKTILEKGRTTPTLRVVSDQIGTPTSALDLAEMIADIIDAPKWVAGTYNFTDEGVASWYDLAVAALELAGIDTPVRPILTADYPTPATRPMYSVLDKSLIKATYSRNIPYWRDSLANVVAELTLETETETSHS